MSLPIVVEVLVVPVPHARDSSHRLAVPERQERLDLRVLVKRVFFGIEEVLEVDQERRHPVRVALVDLPREQREAVEIPRGVDLKNLDHKGVR